MADKRRLTRRRFISRLGMAALGASLTMGLPASAQTDEPNIRYFPLVFNTASFSRVVRVHTSNAAHWDYAPATWFGDFVDQAAVDAMMVRGLCELTGADTAAGAWLTLMPGYVAGQKIAIKVNFNNSPGCDYTENRIDALIEPVNALISTLVARGVRPQDVYVYDARRSIPTAFYKRRRFTQAHYLDATNCRGELATFNYDSTSLRVLFQQPKLAMERWLTDLLYQATYVINMPIMKRHSSNPLTLGFKNHFGSLNYLGGTEPDNPHLYLVPPSSTHYEAAKHPLVDIYANPNIAQKTVLTVGDGLFSASSAGGTPLPWSTFGNHAPNSLLFASDPVAIDCVMADLLNAEWPFPNYGYDYLRLAQQRGLGVFEKGDPWNQGYAYIDYHPVEI
jgi:uncharacterized protein (DUF362 family)